MTVNVPFETACKNLEEDLVLYYYGETSDAEKRRIEDHLSGCRSCGRFVDDLRRLLPQMATAQQFPQSFWDSYYRETLAKLAKQEERSHWWTNLFAPMKMWMLPAFGTVAVAILAIGLVFNRGDSQRLSDRSVEAAIPQEILADANQLEFFKTMDMLESLGKLEEQVDHAEPRPKQSSSLKIIQTNV